MILDTSALIAIFTGEPEGEDFTRAIHAADRCRISSGTFVELAMVLDRHFGAKASNQCDMFLRRAEITIEPITVEHAHLARQAFLDFGKGRHPARLNFGDCFAYALAKAFNEALLFKGENFRQTDVKVVDL